MRIQISADGATEKQLRELLAALSQIGLAGQATVGLDGPTLYRVRTPKLSPNQFASVVGLIVTHDGSPLIEVVRPPRVVDM